MENEVVDGNIDNPSTTNYSSEEYCQKLDNLLISSCEYLRQEFIKRWTQLTNTEWRKGDLEQQAEFLATPEGIEITKKVKNFEPNMLKNWNIDEWDVTLYCSILHQFGAKETYKMENDAIQELKNLRNQFTHSSSNNLTKEKYEEFLNKYRNACLGLGVATEKLEQDIQRASITSDLKTLDLAKLKLDDALNLAHDQEFEKAILLYNDALETPLFVKEHHASVLETRAEVYLSIEMQKLTNEIQEQIKLDLSKAMDLNSKSWKVHFLWGKFSKIQRNLDEAISHFEKALHISPVQNHIQDEVNECKILIENQNKENYIDSKSFSNQIHQMITQVEFRDLSTNRKYSLKEMLDVQNGFDDDQFPGQSLTLKGYKCFNWLRCKQDYNLAAECFESADKIGNAEGYCFLGIMHMYGMGVQRDWKKSYWLLVKAVGLPANSPGNTTPFFHKNYGVAGAQCALGIVHEEGFGVKVDSLMAARWYKTSMMNGMGNGATYLGCLYWQGEGVNKDQKMAEMCFKFGMQLKDSNAAWNLVMCYLREMEPDWAAVVLQIGREMGHIGLITWSDEKFENRLEKIRLLRKSKEEEVNAFEKKVKVTTKGWTFLQRMQRKESVEMCHLEAITSQYNKLNENLRNTGFADSSNGINVNVIRNSEFQNSILLKIISKQSTPTEDIIGKVIKNSAEVKEILETTEDLTTQVEVGMRIMEYIYEICSEGFEIFMCLMEADEIKRLHDLLEFMYKTKCNTEEEHDKIIRILFALLNHCAGVDDANDSVIEILKEGIKRYPDEIKYYDLLMHEYSRKADLNLSLHYVEQGLKRDPNHDGLLRAKIDSLRSGLENSNDKNDYKVAIDEYEKYLKNIPEDHHARPEIFWQLAEIYIQKFRTFSRKHGRVCADILERVKETYKLGVDAEKVQLECYLPYKMSVAKRKVERFFEATENIEKDLSDAVATYSEGVLKKKPYLKSPARAALMKQFRDYAMKKESLSDFAVSSEQKLEINQVPPDDMTVIKPISVLEMNPSESRIYENRLIELLIIEEPQVGLGLVLVLAEDENGDVVRVCLHNVLVSIANFEVGCKIAILNPYMYVQNDINGIVLMEPRCLILRGQVKSLCRFCGEKKAQQKCSNCQRSYCSSECQSLDLKMFDHKTICGAAP